MRIKSVYKAFVVIVLAALLLATVGCTKTKKTAEYIKMSDETMECLTAYQENLLANSKWYMTEEGFAYYLTYLTSRTEQEMPQVDVNNTMESLQYGSETVYTLSGDGACDCVVLYLHGGAYVAGVVTLHVTLCDRLVDTLNAKVYMPLYPLAPQSTFEAAYEMLDALYEDLLKENKPIYIMGDSAGGGFALAYTEYLKANGRKMPSKLVLFSPWVDVTMENKEIAVYEHCDISLTKYGTVECGKMWAGDTDRKDYRISPLYGDLDSLPDILMFVGNHEIIYPDAMKLYDSLTNTNVKVVIGEGLWHVFPIFEIQERETALEMIADFIGGKQ